MPEEQNKVITSVEDLDDLDDEKEMESSVEEKSKEEDVKDDLESTNDKSSNEEEESKEDDVKENPPKTQPESSGQEDEEVEIEGVKYSKDDLDQIFSVGKKVAEYQKEHPGYDPILIHKDYTKKTQELAEIKRFAPAKTDQPEAREEKREKPDLSKFRKEDIDYFEQLASALGYAKAEDIEKRDVQARQQSYETLKRQEVNKFLETHPEYKPGDPTNDLRWSSLLEEYRIYKLPEDPREIGKLLERAHRAVTGVSSSIDSKKAAEIIAKKKAAASGQTSVGGGGGGQSNSSQPKSKKLERLSQIAKSGGLQGYSTEELEEMFG